MVSFSKTENGDTTLITANIATKGETNHVIVGPDRKNNETAYIQDLYVNEAHRGRGLGTLLVINALREAASAGKNFAEVEVESTNEASLGLFAKLGFDVINIIDAKDNRKFLRLRRETDI